MARPKATRHKSVRPPEPTDAIKTSLAAAHAALDTLEQAWRDLPRTDRLIDETLRLRRQLIHTFVSSSPAHR